MSDTPCPCRGDGEASRNTEPSAARIVDADPLDTELPRELRVALGRFLGSAPVYTLGEWAIEVRRRVDGGSVGIEELCVTDERTDHRGTVDGRRYHFACFYDAVLLAALEGQPIDIRTKSPGGTVIEARAAGSRDLTVTPKEAVFSFGIDESVAPPSDDGPTLERGYAAICPYVNAFPHPDAYERWARAAPAATVAIPLDGATDLAVELVRDPSA